VTAMSRASSSSLKRKIKRNSKKRNIKSRKIDKREKNVSVKVFHNSYQKSADVRCSPAPDFKVGDKVFVKAQFF